MELFTKLFSSLLVFVYHCFDRIVIHGYLSGLSRPAQVVYFFRNVVGVPVVDKEALSKRIGEYRGWVEPATFSLGKCRFGGTCVQRCTLGWRPVWLQWRLRFGLAFRCETGWRPRLRGRWRQVQPIHWR